MSEKSTVWLTRAISDKKSKLQFLFFHDETDDGIDDGKSQRELKGCIKNSVNTC